MLQTFQFQIKAVIELSIHQGILTKPKLSSKNDLNIDNNYEYYK